jgi:hypothetical protein
MLNQQPVARVRLHIIEARLIMEKFPMSGKRNNYPPTLEYLFDLGRQTGDARIAQRGDARGQCSTIDQQALVRAHVWGNVCLCPLAGPLPTMGGRLFAALAVAAIGPKRQFAASQPYVRSRG